MKILCVSVFALVSSLGALSVSEKWAARLESADAAYQAAVGNAAIGPGTAGYVPHLDDPTNSPGRIDISANNLDLSGARIQAENFVSIRTDNLISSVATQIEAPYIQIDIANTNSTLTLSYYIYQNAFQFFQMGKAAALAYILFAAIFAVTLMLPCPPHIMRATAVGSSPE